MNPLPIYIALVHHPIVNKQGSLVTTAVTNFDLHDLSRNSTTYDVKSCFIITPIEAQQKMVEYIKSYWQEGVGADYNPDRKEALARLQVSPSLEETRLTIKNKHGRDPLLVATSAKSSGKTISFRDFKISLKQGFGSSREAETPLLILFGTGWGLAPQVLEISDYILEPIRGIAGYNHLPVRSAVAIVLDRLLSDW